MSELFERAKTHIHRSEWEQAIPLLAQHLNGNFDDDIALWSLASAMIETGRHGIGAALLHQALAVRKQKGGGVFTDALASLGAAYFTVDDMERAIGLFEAALEYEKDESSQSNLLANLGKAYTTLGEPEKALHFIERALELRPDNDGAIFSGHFAHLMLGNWREGWQGSEKRFEQTIGQTMHKSYQGTPDWDGSSGKTVVVYGEQGVGDEILFASCLPDLIAVSKHVVFDCHPRLVNLFKRSFPDATIHGTRKVLSQLEWLDNVEVDYSVSLASLPRFFRNCDDDFPGAPYLKALTNGGVADLGKERARFTPVGLRGDGGPSIGFAWAGGTRKTNSHLRSIDLSKMAKIIHAIDADFYSLQYQPEAAKEVCALEETTGIHIMHYPGWVQCDDYDRTASLVASLDLVITVGTSIHHLSNALGVPTWTLVPSRPGWRYTDAGQRFYSSSSRFFRQKGNDWTSAIDEVASALAERFAEKAA